MILFDRTVWKFSLLFFSQFLSLFATGMVEFALGVWAWQETGQATPFAFILFIRFMAPSLLAPIGGILTDRLPRKIMLVVPDVAAGLSSLLALYLVQNGNFRIEYVYLIAAWDAAFSALGGSTFNAMIPELVPEDKLSKANGIKSGVYNTTNVGTPALAGVLFGVIGFQGILVIDIITFTLATILVLILSLPKRLANPNSASSFVDDFKYSIRYLFGNKSYRTLLWLVVFAQMLGAVGQVLLAPMILASYDSAAIYGYAITALGLGAIIGGFLMGSWNGPRNKVSGILLANMGICLFGYLSMALGHYPVFLIFGALSITFFIPLLFGSEMTLWQTQVDPAALGRIFGFRGAFASLAAALVALLVGALADSVFTPLFLSDSSVAKVMAQFVGSGPGAGMRFLFLCGGVSGLVLSLSIYKIPAVQKIQTS